MACFDDDKECIFRLFAIFSFFWCVNLNLATSIICWWGVTATSTMSPALPSNGGRQQHSNIFIACYNEKWRNPTPRLEKYASYKAFGGNLTEFSTIQTSIICAATHKPLRTTWGPPSVAPMYRRYRTLALQNLTHGWSLLSSESMPGGNCVTTNASQHSILNK